MLQIRCIHPYLIVLALALVACGGDAKNDPDPPDCVGVQVGDICRPPDLHTSSVGSDWHPDPDGDGIATEDDRCPYVYDPAQADEDGDGIGDMCDRDAQPFEENGPINDLRAEHVTPYGAWFALTSVTTREFGSYIELAWSTNRADLESASSIGALPEANRRRMRVYENAGMALRRPIIVTTMEPGTRYYVTARRVVNTSLASEASPIIEITTAAAPVLARGGAGPRAWATSEQLDQLTQRHSGGDVTFAAWAAIQGEEALDLVNSSEPFIFGYCLSAALIFRGTGDTTYRDAALSMIGNMRNYWEDHTLDGNELRWANASLGACADLMWSELSDSDRNAIVAAFLEDDEAADPERQDDTDEFASITRTWITDGLVGCQASGVNADLSQRACDMLDRGLRLFYGVQLVKARRDRGFFAQSGGHLADGTGYGRGTAHYWLQTFHVLGNAGANITEYAPWVWHNLLALEIYPLTPKRGGYATFGDLDTYNNFSVEPNSLQIYKDNGGMVALHMGLLARTGFTKEAGYARFYLGEVFPENHSNHGWAMLLYEHDGLTPMDYRTDLDTTYADSGMGVVYARSSWDENASLFVYRSGWAGVDHMHEDLGSFQLYRAGAWVTHESLGYDGAASEAVGHNVMLLDLDYNGDVRGGQYTDNAAGNSRITRLSSTKDYTYAASDQTGAYNSARYSNYDYDTVRRHVLWLAPAAVGQQERVVIYDLVDVAQGSNRTGRRWQLHTDVAPSIDGTSATYTDTAGSRVQVDVVVPATAQLSAADPPGEPLKYPGEVYNHRLFADPGTEERNVRFVSVMRVTDDGAPALTRGVESTDVVGVLTGADLVVFPRSAGGLPSEVSVSVETATNVELWMAGLTPGAEYAVSTSHDGTNLTITVKPGEGATADEAGLLVTLAEIP